MSKHTPGPWTTDYPGYNGMFVDSKGEAIACTGDIESFSTGLRTEECQANARLISTSPELLEVCEESAATLMGIMQITESMPMAIETKQALHKLIIDKVYNVVMVINKAKGEKS